MKTLPALGDRVTLATPRNPKRAGLKGEVIGFLSSIKAQTYKKILVGVKIDRMPCESFDGNYWAFLDNVEPEAFYELTKDI